jgi:hypothetical protein
MERTPVDTPESLPHSPDELYSPLFAGDDGGSEIIKLLVGNDGNTMYALVRAQGAALETPAGRSDIVLLKSTNGGRTWSAAKYDYLRADFREIVANTANPVCWDMAIAPDDPAIIAIAVADPDDGAGITQQVWVSTDGGDNWSDTQWPPATVVPAQTSSAPWTSPWTTTAVISWSPPVTA